YSLKTYVLVEKPGVSFNYKYLLLANKDYNINPVVCSTFKTYKDNEIKDDCVVREIDTNIDGKKDILKFEAHFYTDQAVKSLKLLLFFNFQLNQLFTTTVESIAYLTHTLNEEVQKVCFYGDLILQQKSLLTSEVAAKITNKYVMEEAGYTNDNVIIIQAELVYKDHLIYYQPSIWEELKWIWIQYISCFLVLAYIAKH
ncbi:unnamed protein product, partial [Heterotrigona itama]